jgi:hypothetical protein
LWSLFGVLKNNGCVVILQSIARKRAIAIAIALF